MKNFYYQLLQQLNAKKSEKGFTLIELLVVIIIIGILSAIALPAFLNQANKARQSEAKQALGAINRGQQAYYLERQGFATKIDRLGLGVASFTDNYNYSPDNTAYATGTANANSGDTVGANTGANGWTSYSAVFATASNQAAVRDYIGFAFIVPATTDQESTSRAVLCEEVKTLANDITINTNATLAFTGASDCANMPLTDATKVDSKKPQRKSKCA